MTIKVIVTHDQHGCENALSVVEMLEDKNHSNPHAAGPEHVVEPGGHKTFFVEDRQYLVIKQTDLKGSK